MNKLRVAVIVFDTVLMIGGAAFAFWVGYISGVKTCSRARVATASVELDRTRAPDAVTMPAVVAPTPKDALYFVFLVLREPSGVEFRALETPYYSADTCVDAAVIIYDRIRRKHPAVAGALCYTLDEQAEWDYPVTMKRPL